MEIEPHFQTHVQECGLDITKKYCEQTLKYYNGPIWLQEGIQILNIVNCTVTEFDSCLINSKSFPQFPQSLLILVILNSTLPQKIPYFPTGLRCIILNNIPNIQKIPPIPVSIRIFVSINIPFIEIPEFNISNVLDEKTKLKGGILFPKNHIVPNITTRLFATKYDSTSHNASEDLNFLIWDQFVDSTERIKKRTLVIKEELMAAVWTPDRVIRWTEAGVDMD